MITLSLPGQAELHLEHLVCDVSGTLAVDGRLLPGVSAALTALAEQLTVHLITADTHGRQAELDRQLGLQAVRLQPGDEPAQKAHFVQQLGPAGVAAVGQGANDAAMLKAAALGIAVLSPEGLAVPTLLAADVVMPDILSALALFEHPVRLVATLRI